MPTLENVMNVAINAKKKLIHMRHSLLKKVNLHKIFNYIIITTSYYYVAKNNQIANKNNLMNKKTPIKQLG